MTLIEALQKLESFSRNLQSIILNTNYTGYDKNLEKNCSALISYLNALLAALQNDNIVAIDSILDHIDIRYSRIYYITELNNIFQNNDIEYFDIRQANQWYIDNMANMNVYFEQIQNIINNCLENYQSIYQLMNQKFADRFYNR
jgi:hypothetical protein